MKFNPRAPYELLSKNQETEAAGVCIPDSTINKLAGAHDLILPKLVDSEDETDSKSDSKLDQEYKIKRTNLKHQPDSAPDISDCANYGSERMNSEDDKVSKIMIRNENTGSENCIQILNYNPRTVCVTSERAQLDDIHLSGVRNIII